MAELKNAMEIFKILPKTNCRDCGVPTCLAFAAMVFKGERPLSDCPHLADDTIKQHQVLPPNVATLDQEQVRQQQELQEKVRSLDLASAAERCGNSRRTSTR